MWIFSELGFYSVNLTPSEDWLQFRARKKSDVENLKREFPKHFAGQEVMTLPSADYRYRIETTPAKAALVMCELTKRIQYRNFKSHLEKTDQADKLGILHNLWHELHDYQQGQERPKAKAKSPFLPWDEQGYGRTVRQSRHDEEIEAKVQGELSDYLAGWPNPEDEDDSIASLTEPFPDWEGPTNKAALDGDGWPQESGFEDDQGSDEEILCRTRTGWKWEAP